MELAAERSTFDSFESRDRLSSIVDQRGRFGRRVPVPIEGTETTGRKRNEMIGVALPETPLPIWGAVALN
jgi:hypothetical protein